LEKNNLRNCDVLDATFACIGGVDLLQNSLDFVRVNPTKKAIVIAGDYAKYALNSSGEYTQGAGVVALLLSANPSIISFENRYGVATKSEHDFFKPRRYFSKDEVPVNTSRSEVEIFSDEPIFDGQFSNQCYQDRIREAYYHLKEQKNNTDILHQTWSALIFHLPYAFHGRRIFTEIFALEKGYSLEQIDKDVLKELSKSEEYKQILNDKIIPAEKASSEVGNLYTASIFMAMLSTLKVAQEENKALENTKFGFIAYGSGSKSKVFEGIIEPTWKQKIQEIPLFETLEKRQTIDFETYEKLHNKELKSSIISPANEFILTNLEKENPNQLGARYYEFIK
jgi:hydroxymethylglutaryl-CoA synthase